VSLFVALRLVALVGTVLVGGTAAGESSRFIPGRDGEAPPALGLNDLAGRRHSLADHRGRVVLINFWATWCDPCRDEMPSLQKLKAELAGRPFEVLAVNYGESEARVSEFLKRHPMDFPILLDPNQDAARAWRVRILPASFLVDARGRLGYRVIGELDWATDEARETVRRMLP
jgi:thiol-disulfide isomerase/thioredoxin